MKLCGRCDKEMGLSEFSKNKSSPDGYSFYCRDCKSKKAAESYQRHRESVKRAAQAYRRDNPEKVAELKPIYYQENKGKILSDNKKYQQANKASISAQRKAYRQENKGPVNARNAKRHTAKLHRTPKWLTEEDIWLIGEFYELSVLRTKLTGVKQHVDHIVPLQGKLVSGLHVPQNLQVIPAKENLNKHNTWEA